MAFEIISRQDFCATDQDYDQLRQFLGLCGDEPLDFFLEAAVDRVEQMTCCALRPMRVHFTTRGGNVCLPFGASAIETIKCVSADGVRMAIACPNGATSEFCLPVLKKCKPCNEWVGYFNQSYSGEHYEITYQAKPLKEIPPVFRIAIFKVAKAFYDDEQMPDLSSTLKGYLPTDIERFFKAVGGMSLEVL